MRSSGSGKLSTEYFQKTIKKLKNNNLDDGTKESYHAAWVSFNDFFVKLDKKPEDWVDRITLFVAYLIDRRQPEKTIRSYASGIKRVLHDEGIVIDNKSYLLASLLKACK